MEFSQSGEVVINPLRIKRWIKDELNSSMILFNLGTSRNSSEIISSQEKNIKNKGNQLEAMHKIKKSSYDMKNYLMRGDIRSMAEVMNDAWKLKKSLTTKISSDKIDIIHELGVKSGAYSGKISGAGGGGIMMFMINPRSKINLINEMKKIDLQNIDFVFTNGGSHCWKLY